MYSKDPPYKFYNLIFFHNLKNTYAVPIFCCHKNPVWNRYAAPLIVSTNIRKEKQCVPYANVVKWQDTAMTVLSREPTDFGYPLVLTFKRF